MPAPPSSSSSSSASRRSIPPLVLLSFAVLHSQVYWLYSIIYHLCNNLSDRPLDLTLDDTVLQALTRRSGRARAFSEPQKTSCVMLQQRQVRNDTLSKPVRPRSTTINATTVDDDTPLRRQQWVRQFHACADEQQQKHQQRLLEAAIADERLGRTRPPRWWQRTRRHLTRQDKVDDIELTSSISSISAPLPSIDFKRTNRNDDHHLTPPRSVPPSPPMQPHYHHEITTTMRIEETAAAAANGLDAFDLSTAHQGHVSSISSSSTITTRKQRPLAKMRSVLIKSQIGPEKASLNPKRITILGIPSRWTTTLISNNNNNDPQMKKRDAVVRIMDRPLSTISLASGSKRHLFSSLPAWKRKSVG